MIIALYHTRGTNLQWRRPLRFCKGSVDCENNQKVGVEGIGPSGINDLRIFPRSKYLKAQFDDLRKLLIDKTQEDEPPEFSEPSKPSEDQ